MTTTFDTADTAFFDSTGRYSAQEQTPSLCRVVHVTRIPYPEKDSGRKAERVLVCVYLSRESKHDRRYGFWLVGDSVCGQLFEPHQMRTEAVSVEGAIAAAGAYLNWWAVSCQVGRD